MKKLLLILISILSTATASMAQCAMCKTTIVNNVSNGELALADGLNFGIMYLFVTPYLSIGVVAAIWFYKYKQDGKKKRRPSFA